MIQDIAPHRYDNAYHPRPPQGRGPGLFLPGHHYASEWCHRTALPVGGGGGAGRSVPASPLLICLPLMTWPSTGAMWCPRRFWRPPSRRKMEGSGHGTRWIAFACITASQLHGWYHDHQFCGRCGFPAEPDKVERAMRCPACGNLVYPTISPAVIVAVTHGNRLLPHQVFPAWGHPELRPNCWFCGDRRASGGHGAPGGDGGSGACRSKTSASTRASPGASPAACCPASTATWTPTTRRSPSRRTSWARAPGSTGRICPRAGRPSPLPTR